MKFIRIGNDINLSWTINRFDSPEDFTDKEITVKLLSKCGCPAHFDFSIEDNKILGTFYGKDQYETGAYRLVLVENEGKPNMATLDFVDAFCLSKTLKNKVASGEDSASNINVETVELTSTFNTNEYIEKDPIFTASPAAKITDENISDWNEKQDKLQRYHEGNNMATIIVSKIDDVAFKSSEILVTPDKIHMSNGDAYINFNGDELQLYNGKTGLKIGDKIVTLNGVPVKLDEPIETLNWRQFDSVTQTPKKTCWTNVTKVFGPGMNTGYNGAGYTFYNETTNDVIQLFFNKDNEDILYRKFVYEEEGFIPQPEWITLNKKYVSGKGITVSGNNEISLSQDFKTINGESIEGTGNITVQTDPYDDTELRELISAKTDNNTFNTFKQEVNNNLDSKTDNSTFNAFKESVNTTLDGKTDNDTFNTFKQEVNNNLDAKLSDAPSDDKLYVRLNGRWRDVKTYDDTEVRELIAGKTDNDTFNTFKESVNTSLDGKTDNDTFNTFKQEVNNNLDSKLSDAPNDGQQYARQNGGWSVVTGGGEGGGIPDVTDNDLYMRTLNAWVKKNPVNYYNKDEDHVVDCNECWHETGFYKVWDTTLNIPEGTQWSILLSVVENPATGNCLQMLFATTNNSTWGKTYTRTGMGANGNWTAWKELGAGGGGSLDGVAKLNEDNNFNATNYFNSGLYIMDDRTYSTHSIFDVLFNGYNTQARETLSFYGYGYDKDIQSNGDGTYRIVDGDGGYRYAQAGEAWNIEDSQGTLYWRYNEEDDTQLKKFSETQPSYPALNMWFVKIDTIKTEYVPSWEQVYEIPVDGNYGSFVPVEEGYVAYKTVIEGQSNTSAEATAIFNGESIDAKVYVSAEENYDMFYINDVSHSLPVNIWNDVNIPYNGRIEYRKDGSQDTYADAVWVVLPDTASLGSISWAQKTTGVPAESIEVTTTQRIDGRAATKEEVNTKIDDAPFDGQQYARQNGGWSVVSGGGGGSIVYNDTISDCNDYNVCSKTGFYHVGSGTANRPENSSWGVLINSTENTSNGTCFQMYLCTSNNGTGTFGKVYTRAGVYYSMSQWTELGAGGGNTENKDWNNILGIYLFGSYPTKNYIEASDGDGLYLPSVLDFASMPGIIEVKVHINLCTNGSNGNQQQIFDSGYGLAFALNADLHPILAVSSNGTSWDAELSADFTFEPNRYYDIDITFTNNFIYVVIDYTQVISASTGGWPYPRVMKILDSMVGGQSFNGTLNLDKCYITAKTRWADKEVTLWEGKTTKHELEKAYANFGLIKKLYS